MMIRLTDVRYECETVPIRMMQSGDRVMDRVVVGEAMYIIEARIVLSDSEFRALGPDHPRFTLSRLEDALNQALFTLLHGRAGAPTTQERPDVSRTSPAPVSDPVEARFERIAAALPPLRPPTENSSIP